jgi:uncharacterized phage protein (TIGR01671 family)
MREIKFRAWDSEENKMIEWDDTFFSDMSPVTRWSSYFSFIDMQLMQFTGLKDRNGKEIYEGDILTAPYYPFQDDGKYNYHGVIEWIDELASFYMTKRLANSEKRGISDGISEQIDDISNFEVIGNIYEIPELL